MAYSHSLLAAAAALAFCIASIADNAIADIIPCESFVPGHRMTSSKTGIHKFVDGRTMTGKKYNVGGCGTYSTYPTGTEYRSNYTFLSYHSEVTSDTCLVKSSGGLGVYDSFQAVVISANGYKWTPKLSVDDIDALPTTSFYGGVVDTWRESAVVFGVADDRVVYPSLSFSSGTLLLQKKYIVRKAALDEIGLSSLGEVTVVGSEFNADKMLYNCPFADAGTASRCRMTVEFNTPVSHLVILYGAAQKSMQDPNAAIFFSEITLPCSCMCSTTVGKGVMYTESPHSPGRCFRTEAEQESRRTACDMLATEQVCTFEYKKTLTRTGPVGKDGLYPCEEVLGPTMTGVQPYKP